MCIAQTVQTTCGNADGDAPAWERRRCGLTVANYPTGASSSKKLRVLFGSTGMPGAIVEVKVIFFR